MIRYFSITEQRWPLAVMTLSLRHVRHKLSPDRTRNEEIADRQNAFVWSEHHVYRPHQHFTYDPCSWNRPLEEKTKANKKLSLVERLKALEDREADMKSKPAQESASSSSTEICFEDYAYCEAPTVPLQDLLEEWQMLHNRLSFPRYANTALVVQERQRVAYTEVLRLIFERVRCAVIGESITLNAFLYAWFRLLQSAPDLLAHLANGGGRDNDNDDHDDDDDDAASVDRAIATARSALSVLLRSVSQGLCAESLSPEALVELLAVATHPLAGDDCAPLVERARQMALSAVACADELSLGPAHVSALLRGLSRDSKISNLSTTTTTTKTTTAPLPTVLPLPVSVVLLLVRVATETGDAMRAATRPSRGNKMRAALTGRKVREDAKGIVRSPGTEPGDVFHCTAAIALLARTWGAAAPKAQEAADAVARMLSFAPNYDLDVALTASAVCDLADANLITGEARQMQAMLLLSRLRLESCADKPHVLLRLMRFLSEASPPIRTHTEAYSEWRRLRGLTMHQVLQSVEAKSLCEVCTQWEERLAFGTYDGPVPIRLWRNACEARRSSVGGLGSASARALLALRPRCAGPLDLSSIDLLAALLAAQGIVPSDARLCEDGAAWDYVCESITEDESLRAMLRQAQRRVLERQADQHVVTTFA